MLTRQRRPWRPQMTKAEMGRGWVFFALYVLVFPWVMGWVQRAFQGALPVAEANVVYYLLSAVLVFLVFWTFLKHGFHLLLDWLPENLFAFVTGLIAAGVLHFLMMRIPLPVENPNSLSYPEQFALAPAATVVILVVLMPMVEETLFRGLLFGSSRRYSRALGYVLSTLVYAVYCVWQFVFTYGQVDFRYLLLFVQYLPMSLALTWCYDNGGSIWSPSHVVQPHVQVISRVSDHRRFSGRPGTCMITHDVFLIHCKKPVRIIVPEICFICKRQTLQILQCLHIVRPDPRRIHLVPVRLYTIIDVADRIL